MRPLFLTLIGFVFILKTSLSFAQTIELAEDKVKWNFSVEQKGCEATLIATVKVVKGWHINSIVLPKGSFGINTELKFTPSSDFQFEGKIIEPKPILKHDDAADEDLSYHEGVFKFKQKIKILSKKDFSIKGNYSFQTCNELTCLPPADGAFEIKIKGCESETVQTQIIDTTNKNTAEINPSKKLDQTTITNQKTIIKKNKEDNRSLITLFLLSFASGIAALLTPCVFPMIPMTVSFFTKQSKTKSAGIRNALIYGLSIIVIYILLGTVVTASFGADVLNNMSTNPTFNIVFFVLLIIFAVSFMGAFEIRMPSSWINKADQASDRGGLIGIFFMALALALVSFSCTGPIVGTLIVEAASKGGIAPVIGMLGFSVALALPFALFAAFPGWMNSLPKSGGWLNTVKVVLGLLELALAFKFLSNADLSLQAHYLEREVFLAIWIAIFGLLAMYLLGFVRMPHDSPLEKLSVGRALFGTTVLAFVMYLIPGMWGAPLKLISAFPPPLNYSEAPLGFGGVAQTVQNATHIEGTHLGPQNIMVFDDFDKAQAYAKKVGKPLFVDFTGHNCVNCRKMEEQVWGEPGIIDVLKNDVVIASLHVDERIDLPKKEQTTVEIVPGRMKKIKTTGDKWMAMEILNYKSATQPYYVMLNQEGKQIDIGSADYENHRNPNDFKKWLDSGLKLFKDNSTSR